jgi:hypothetical protein
MASWQEERDRLIAQTQDFVEQVAAASPRVAPPFAPKAANATTQLRFSPPETLAPPGRPDVAVAPIAVPDPQPRYDAISDRAEILERVAAFRIRQSQLARDRETYYEEMQARIRKTLRNDSGPDRL